MDEDLAFQIRQLNRKQHEIERILPHVPFFASDCYHALLTAFVNLGVINEEQAMYVDRHVREQLEKRLAEIREQKPRGPNVT